VFLPPTNGRVAAIGLRATPLLREGDRQPIGIKVLGDPSPKNLFRLLTTGDLSLDHPVVEFVEVRNAQTWTATSGRNLVRIVSFRTGHVACVEREGRTIGCELGPSGGLEFQGKAEHISIEPDGPLHVAHEHDWKAVRSSCRLGQERPSARVNETCVRPLSAESSKFAD
jgi:hypothetical protein